MTSRATRCCDRRSSSIRLRLFSPALGICIGYLLLPSEMWSLGLVLLTVDAILTAGYHWWSRVTISADLVTTGAWWPAAPGWHGRR